MGEQSPKLLAGGERRSQVIESFREIDSLAAIEHDGMLRPAGDEHATEAFGFPESFRVHDASARKPEQFRFRRSAPKLSQSVRPKMGCAASDYSYG
jgi:hypothetical protein